MQYFLSSFTPRSCFMTSFFSFSIPFFSSFIPHHILNFYLALLALLVFFSSVYSHL
jgi:hypothetical protein